MVRLLSVAVLVLWTELTLAVATIVSIVVVVPLTVIPAGVAALEGTLSRNVEAHRDESLDRGFELLGRLCGEMEVHDNFARLAVSVGDGDATWDSDAGADGRSILRRGEIDEPDCLRLNGGLLGDLLRGMLESRSCKKTLTLVH
ncbi:MAG: hypothetical protein AAB229_05470 [Candidatus Hydrogenedentota bacterium]